MNVRLVLFLRIFFLDIKVHKHSINVLDDVLTFALKRHSDCLTVSINMIKVSLLMTLLISSYKKGQK